MGESVIPELTISFTYHNKKLEKQKVMVSTRDGGMTISHITVIY
jgi:hypothetical protein